MFPIPGLTQAFSLIKKHVLDDAVDRLNYFMTPMILIFFNLMISTKQLFGSPIQCVTPAEMKSGWEEYIEDYCFVSNTYIIRPHGQDYYAPRDLREREESEINFYQWVPVILAIQAFLFYLPNLLWRMLHKQSGIDMNGVMREIDRIRKEVKGAVQRNMELEILAKNLAHSLGLEDKPKKVLGIKLRWSMGCYVTLLYFVIKLLYLANIVLQFYLMSHFLNNHHFGTSYSLWGFDVLRQLFNGQAFQESAIFPRVTFCDFVFAKLKSSARYTVQCVLMINMWNEKIYLFLWFWCFFIGIATLVNFFYCLVTFGPNCWAKTRHVRRYMKSIKASKAQEVLAELNCKTEDCKCYKKTPDYTHFKQTMQRFASDGLRTDGILLLRFIENHAGTHMARELFSKLFQEFLNASKDCLESVTTTTDSGISDTASTSTDSTYQSFHPSNVSWGQQANENMALTMRTTQNTKEDGYSTAETVKVEHHGPEMKV